MLTSRKILTGFTLIELLVVISIVGFLTVAAVFSFNIVRTQSRDAIRTGNVSTISRALAMYMKKNVAPSEDVIHEQLEHYLSKQ